MKKPEKTFTLALITILIDAAIWLIFAILLLSGVFSMGVLPIALRWIMLALALIAAVVLFVLAILLRKHNSIAYYLTLVVLTGLVLLTFMDQVGILDLIYAVIALTPLVLLLVCRRWYFQNKTQ
jgi:asparagine N-glycosylation enzyme membrane subunit Stt3